MHERKLRAPGYAYRYDGSHGDHWRSSHSEDWEIVVIRSRAEAPRHLQAASPVWIGDKVIDGVRCGVFETPEGDIVAQALSHMGVSP